MKELKTFLLGIAIGIFLGALGGDIYHNEIFKKPGAFQQGYQQAKDSIEKIYTPNSIDSVYSKDVEKFLKDS